MANIKVKFKEAYQDFGAYALLKNVTDKGVLIVDGTEVLNSIADLPTTNTVDGQEKAVIVQNGQVVTTSINNIAGSGGSPAGSDTQIQYNNAGAFGADAGFTRDVAGGSTTILNTTDFGGGETIGGGITTTGGITTIEQIYSASAVPASWARLQIDGTENSINLTTANYTTGDTNGFYSKGAITVVGNLSGGNNTKITIDDVTQLVTISNVPTYADDAAAAIGGLTSGMLYKTTTGGITALNIVP